MNKNSEKLILKREGNQFALTKNKGNEKEKLTNWKLNVYSISESWRFLLRAQIEKDSEIGLNE